MKHIVLIPAYQPDEALLRLVLTMRLYGLTVIVVDDGSGEDYARGVPPLNRNGGI